MLNPSSSRLRTHFGGSGSDPDSALAFADLVRTLQYDVAYDKRGTDANTNAPPEFLDSLTVNSRACNRLGLARHTNR